LQRTEIGEVEEPFPAGKVGSSTMPHKRNPMVCEAVLALSRLVMRSIPLALDAMIQDHERDWTADHIEWAYLGEVCMFTDGALVMLTDVLRGLEVNAQRMLRNLEMDAGLILSEAVMLELGKSLGRQSAHEIVYECAMQAHEGDVSFRQAVREHPMVFERLSETELDRLLDPHAYAGLAGQFVDRVLAAYQGA